MYLNDVSTLKLSYSSMILPFLLLVAILDLKSLHTVRGGGGGVLWVSSDGDDQRIFGFEIFDSGIFWGRKIWQVIFCVA